MSLIGGYMNEQEIIVKILEEYGPITKVNIAKRIYKDFDGYKCPGWKVKKHLWDESTLAKIVVYDKSNYTYDLIGNIEDRIAILSSNQSHFNFKINHLEKKIGSNKFIEYSIIGKDVTIDSYIGKENIDKLIQAIVMVQMETSPNDETINKYMNHLNARLIDLF
jgi:repressor of nif and glnA expression